MKIKSKQKLRVIRYCNDGPAMMVYCTYGKLEDTVDYNTAAAVQEAVKTIVDDRFQYKGITATFKGMSLQVNLLD